ncbi:hypothetical protein [Qipengyuania sp. MTN3-11]|uniref:hypothetical protein n=1 Tax=Qipengyuania sp. MTN3-11 TaxID=3056557 RepID=UPI0036F1AB05
MTSAEPPSRRRRAWLALALGIPILLFLLVTGSEPWVPPARAATAEQVALAQDAYLALRSDRPEGEPVSLRLEQAQLGAITALISQGFAPNRLAAELEGDTLAIAASRPLLFRWLNMRALIRGESEGFPEIEARVGAIPVPSWLARDMLELVLGRSTRAAEFPPLDELVRSVSIARDSATLSVDLPPSGLLDRLSGAPMIDDRMVAAIYCALAKRQREQPEPLFANQLQRALHLTRPVPEQHGAALVALAMIAVAPEAGDLTGEAAESVRECAIAPVALTLQGRPDSPKHWALSAALEVTTGTRFTAAIGEWKELADGLSRNPLLGPNDPSGFSFVDLATDRAGFLTARNLTDPKYLESTRARLLKADDNVLLPPATLGLTDGMPNVEFVELYGATDDPRFERKIAEIDAMLRRGGIE